MPTNVSVLIVGDGRSMFTNSIHMPVKGSKVAEAKEKVKQVIADKETMDQLRKFFVALTYHHKRTMSEFTIPAAVAEHAQQTFITKR